MITYETFLGGTRVMLEGKRIGVIQAAGDGWQYLPSGEKKYAGPIYPTIERVKQDIEEE